MAKNTRLTEEEYRRIKEMQNAGLTKAQVKQFSDRSEATVYYIFESNTYAEYRAAVTRMAKRSNDRRKAAKESLGLKEEQKEGQPKEEAVIPDRPRVNVTELQLKRIADQLERLADAWEAQPVKRRLF